MRTGIELPEMGVIFFFHCHLFKVYKLREKFGKFLFSLLSQKKK